MSNDGSPNANQPSVDVMQISSAKLFGDQKEIIIIHNGERYSLRITANRKLILTK